MSAAESAQAVTHSVWKNRMIYSWVVSLGLLVGLIGSAFMDKSDHTISVLAGSLITLTFLTIVAPSAEQVVKMFQQVAAIRAGK